MPLASRASEELGYNQLLLAGYDSENHPARPEVIGIRFKEVPGVGSATPRLVRIPDDDARELEAPAVVYECALRPDAENELRLSVMMPDDYEVLALTIER